jgi:hypothetical protein
VNFQRKSKKLRKRIKKIEEQPLPSKVSSPKVVEKGELIEEDEEVRKINKRLAELDEIKENDLDRFQAGRMWEEAIELVNKKNKLLKA